MGPGLVDKDWSSSFVTYQLKEVTAPLRASVFFIKWQLLSLLLPSEGGCEGYMS